MTVLEIQHLYKRYGQVQAVQDLNLRLEAGQIFGLLGPNGSGKTTTLGIIMGIIRPDSGSFQWFGNSSAAHQRRKIGCILETPNFYPYLNADENLQIVAHIKKEKTRDFTTLLELVGLKESRQFPFHTFSLGMKQRLAIAAALIGDPEVIIFDEPTNGLDPAGIASIREIIRSIASKGKTIILASHILDEVEKRCTSVGILKNGQLITQLSLGGDRHKTFHLEVSAANLQRLSTFLKNLPGCDSIIRLGEKLETRLSTGMTAEMINKRAFEEGIILSHLRVRHMSLEEEFLRVTSNN